MKRFDVKVRTANETIAYSAIGSHSFDIHAAAIDLFGPCSVIVKAKK